MEVNLLTDNESVRYLLTAGKSRDPLRLSMARLIVGEQFRGEFRIIPARITTEQNTLADALSRLGEEGKWDLFSATVGESGAAPTQVFVREEFFDLEPTR